MNPHIPIETEVKLRIPSTGELAPRLAALGFRLEVPAQPESSVLWDRGGELFAQGCALRVRSYGGRAWVTWKGPKVSDPLLKIRPEIETAVASAEAMGGILQALGYHPVLAMEKTRALLRREDLTACLDETPFGCYLELEGEPGTIRGVMESLGLGPELAEVRSYPDLFVAHGAAAPESTPPAAG
ncbi:MAG TPA: class IV adenylate cyclase [Holophaga sp.]|nr:class IV adenylate cyclase [Holophaga sp.]HPS68287.1 class IV adenylate cyclase [Holophaga sp.]